MSRPISRAPSTGPDRASQPYFGRCWRRDTLATTRTSKAAIAEQLASVKKSPQFRGRHRDHHHRREAQARFDLASAQEIAAEQRPAHQGIALDQLVGPHRREPQSLAVPVVLPRRCSRAVDETCLLAPTPSTRWL